MLLFVAEIGLDQSGCRNDSHCTNSGAICSGNKCICHETRFFDGYQCLKSKWAYLSATLFDRKVDSFNT